MFIGVAFKENLGVLLPYFVARSWSEVPRRRLIVRSFVLCAVFALSFFGVRSGVWSPGRTGVSESVSIYDQQEYFEHVLKYWGGPSIISSKIFSVFTLSWIYLAFGAYRWARTEWPCLILLAAVVAQMPFATDIERMIAAAFPVVYLFVGRVIDPDNFVGRALGIHLPAVGYLAFKTGIGYREVVLIFALLSMVCIARSFAASGRGTA
jgi:hypothetical protein